MSKPTNKHSSKTREIGYAIPFPQTAESAKKYIREHGLCVTEIARQHNISRFALVDLLRGRRKGFRGETHRAAILLGLKADPTTLKRAA
ncbi:MAG: DNA-binding protein [Oxalobacter sp.]|nr:MAG: DNA-binding protein [Oxalobacter sp.]